MNGGGCTSSQYISSDAACSSQFGSGLLDAPSQSCNVSSPPQKPCDVDDIVLNEIPATRTAEHKKVDGKWKEEPPPANARAISLTGASKVAKQPVLEVVGDRMDAAAKTQIRAYVYPFAAHDASHVLVRVTRPNEPEIERHCPALDNVTFPVYRRASSSFAGSLFERFITFHLSPNEYRVTVESCGVRNSGSVVGGGSLLVHVYPADQYTLSLSVPALGRRSYSRSRTHGFSGRTDSKERRLADGVRTSEKTERGRDGVTSYSRETTREGYTVSHSESRQTLEDGSALTITEPSEVKEAEPDEPTIEFKRNGQAEDVTANITKLFKALRSVEKAVKAIKDLIQEWQPQVGWKFEFDVSFMSGKMAMSWGWKEFTDHRVYFAWSAQITITIFKISLMLSFGLQIGPALARLEGGIEDASVDVNSTWDFHAPDMPVVPTAKASASIPAVIRGRAEADLYVVRVSAAAGIRSGFNVDGGTRLNDARKFELYAKIAWTGIDAFISTCGPDSGEEEDVYHLIDKKDIWEGAVPI